MARKRAIEISFSAVEVAQLQRAADVVSVDLTSFIRNAALAMAGNTQKSSYSKYDLGSISREAASRGHIWQEAELQERNLPLYWSETWVRNRLAEGKSVKQIALLCGSPLTTVSNYLRRVYNIQAHRILTEEDIAAIRQRYAAGESRRHIAADMGVTATTVGKYLKGLPTEYERNERAARKRLGQQVQEIPAEPLPPNVQGLKEWSERLFEERVQLIGSWPTSTKTIADRVFAGDRASARDWTGRMVDKGRLMRLAPGWFDLPKSESVELLTPPTS